jgi:hypothetical protein
MAYTVHEQAIIATSKLSIGRRRPTTMMGLAELYLLEPGGCSVEMLIAHYLKPPSSHFLPSNGTHIIYTTT